MIAKVYVSIEEPSIDIPYNYFVPPTMAERIQRGRRVIVPFGNGNKKIEGVVVSVTEEQNKGKLKPISYVLDDELVSEYSLSLAGFIKERYFCTFFEALRPLLPPGGYKRYFEEIYINPEAALEECDDAELEIYLHVREKKCVSLNSLELTYKNRKRSIASLIERGILTAKLSGEKRASDKTVKYAEAVKGVLNEIARESHREIYAILMKDGPMSVKEITYAAGCSPSVLSTMEKHGYVNIFDAPVSRSFYKSDGKHARSKTELTFEQNEVYTSLCALFDEDKPNAALLYGVTGSGKTEVYIKLIEHAIERGRNAIVLLPEIGLSPQVFSAFRNYFGDIVGLMHSKMSQGERYDEYMRIKRGEVRIVIGTRMAVFSNIENVGVIIMDEEQEHTYISEMPPKYHALDIAKYRCAADNALLVLGSATPSLESFYYAKTGRYHLLRLTKRYGGTALPAVSVADMTRELMMGNASQISGRLLFELEKNLSSGEQSILFLNRRGYSTFVSCAECGHVVKCKNCSLPLRYHKKNGRMVCHICGCFEEVPEKCPECGNEMIKFSGAGTQKVEDQINELLPNARIMRMDADTTMSKRAHDEMLSRFASGEADILIGTQMVSKGLDFDNVTLVGVLNADAAMYSDDFRGAETTFSQVTQVIGRAGRRNVRGRALIQTASPHSQIISQCIEGDYEKFYESEIELRRALIYPPFCDLAFLTVSSPMEETANALIYTLDDIIKRKLSENRDIKVVILGPAPPSVSKVNNKYRMRIILKCRNTKKFRDFLRGVIFDFSKEKKGAKARLGVEINPANV